ncbi:hypothetical protein [uncultured Tenacibaculum sp.]|uniref:hypothetical protein n=1 Tax=uncultured Tenacibaculum sp. TaxID=174713 RepID=UPI0026257EF3|nr:hypothetical protein [uncultured Tenacibaculum sp.]
MKKKLFTFCLTLLFSFSMFAQEKENKKETLPDGWYKAYSNCITPNGFATINLKTNFRRTITVWIKAENNMITHIGRTNSKELHNNRLNDTRLFSAPVIKKRHGKTIAELRIVGRGVCRARTCVLEIIDDNNLTASR